MAMHEIVLIKNNPNLICDHRMPQLKFEAFTTAAINDTEKVNVDPDWKNQGEQWDL